MDSKQEQESDMNAEFAASLSSFGLQGCYYCFRGGHECTINGSKRPENQSCDLCEVVSRGLVSLHQTVDKDAQRFLEQDGLYLVCSVPQNLVVRIHLQGRALQHIGFEMFLNSGTGMYD